MTEKVWAYVLSKALNEIQEKQFLQNCSSFTGSWTAHDQPLSANYELFKNRILVVRVDETAYNASGCSIDKLQRFIQTQEAEFGIQLLNRLLVALEVNGDLTIVHSSKIKEMLSAGTINENTPVYDTAVSDSEQLKEWKKPLKNTWLNKYTEGISR